MATLRAPLRALAESERFFRLDMLERYYQDQQDSTKRYDWDGSFIATGMAEYSPIAPGYYVPYTRRRPSTRYRLARVIVNSLTEMAMVMPELNVEGDETAEAAIRGFAKAAGMQDMLREVRRRGGQMGTGCVSLSVVRGAFRFTVHNPKHCQVIDWADRAEFVCARVMKAYQYELEEFDADKQAMAKNRYWTVHLWDGERETYWEKIPDEVAETADWSVAIEPVIVEHGFGFCPFYWVQNATDSDEEDGEGDYEGATEKLDAINRLASATQRGTLSNVDPTLVIGNEDDGEMYQKGSGGVIHAPGGASYLELQGTAVSTAIAWKTELKQEILDECGVVIPDQERLTNAAQSAAAMRILFRPMISKCNALRDQYGRLIVRLSEDMLRIARVFRDVVVQQKRENDTIPIQRVIRPELDPGQGEKVTLTWPRYFEPTAQDVQAQTTTAMSVSGNKPLIARRTAMEYVADTFGVEDVEAEEAEVEKEADEEAERMQKAMGDAPDPKGLSEGGPSGPG